MTCLSQPTSAPESTTVLHELDGSGVLTLTLNRPERHNAWNRDLEVTLHTLLERASRSEEVRVILLTGAGRSFCPGLDSEDLDRVSRTGPAKDRSGRRPILLPTLTPKPIICAINGSCAGVGLVTALMADVRFASENAKITTAYARRGLPAEEAISWILPRIVGHAVASDLLLSSRVVLGAEAASIGLVNWAVPRHQVLERAHSYAEEMALNCSPIAMAAAKRQVYRDWSGTLADSRLEARSLIRALQKASPDFTESIRSFVEERPARFEGYREVRDSDALAKEAVHPGWDSTMIAPDQEATSPDGE
jgi:enoyl-CoA hydratase/carnithine racemase